MVDGTRLIVNEHQILVDGYFIKFLQLPLEISVIIRSTFTLYDLLNGNFTAVFLI
jgi:hypothetical protein